MCIEIMIMIGLDLRLDLNKRGILQIPLFFTTRV